MIDDKGGEMAVRMWAGILEKDGIGNRTRPATFSAAYDVGYGLKLQYEISVLTSQTLLRQVLGLECRV